MKIRNSKYLYKGYSPAVFWFYLFLSLLAAQSCKKYVYGNTQHNDKLVVLAEITADDTANIPVSKSIIAGSGNQIVFQKIDNASVSINEQGGATQRLWLNNSIVFSNNPASIYSNNSVFKYNTDYTIHITHPELGPVSATTHIPGPFMVDSIDSYEDNISGKPVLVFDFTINDPPAEKNYYIFDAVKQIVKLYRYFYWQGVQYNYNTPEGLNLFEQVKDQPGVTLIRDTIPINKYIRLSVFTRDIKTDNDEFSSLDSSFRRIFIRDSLFSGQPYTSRLAVSRDHFVAADSTETGIVRLRINSVSKELYDYLSQYEKYKSSFGGVPISQLSSPVGNIQNGLGVFGGVARKEWIFYYDVLQ